MVQEYKTHWNVWRKGSKTFAEKIAFDSKVEPREGESVYLKLSPPYWRITNWEIESETNQESVFKVWVKRTSS